MLDQNNYQRFTIEKHDNGIAVLTLNRPDKNNAVDKRTHYEFSTFANDADADPDVRVIVITGEGKSFCGGGDPTWNVRDPAGLPALRKEAQQVVFNLLDCEKPVISALTGFTMGVGATLALLCDIVVADTTTTIADPHVLGGVGAGDGGQVIWPLLMGVNRAKYFLMTGEQLSAEDARELGLLNFVVDEGQALDKALEIAKKLTYAAPLAVKASKSGINAYIKSIANIVLPLTLEQEIACMKSEDAGEAMAAFMEKRRPQFTGK